MVAKKSPFTRDTAAQGRKTPAQDTRIDANYDGKNSASRKAQRKHSKGIKGS